MARFYLQDHQHKGAPYARALEQCGWERSEHPSDIDLKLALFDHDVGDGGRGFRRGMDYLHERGVAIMLYPHAARPMVQWDGMYPIWPHTRMKLAPAEGHREVLKTYGYPLPVEVTGWAMCEQRAFSSPLDAIRSDKRKVEVLFGPIHPNQNGWLHPVDRAQNAVLFQRLLETPGIRLTVRHIFRLELNGLWQAPGVKYVLANPNGSTEEIDAADVVIGHQTFAYLAVARGRPVIMFGDDVTAHSGNAWENLRWASHYEAYREIMRYPLEAEAARSPSQMREMMECAMGADVGCAWRERFVGEPMTPDRLMAAIEKYLN